MATAPQHALTSARLGFPLDEAKLAVPRTKRRFVARPGLVRRLTGEKRASVVSISAPAGYGKTTLLAQWAARERRPFAYVGLDRRDNDAVILMAHVAAALETVYEIDPGVFEALGTPDSSIWSSDAPRLLAAFERAPAPVVLALDDVHEVVDRDACDLIVALAHHVPPGSLLALAGRRGTPAGLPRLRAEGTLLELGTPDLALDDDEARVLLQRSGVDATPEQAHAVNGRAEGWAAGLYLASLAAQLEPAEPWADGAVDGADRFVSDYLRTEHLARLGRKRLRFLAPTSILERLSGPLCDAVLGTRDAARMLDALDEEHLFVVPLDRRRDWFRYHHLFGEMLRAELERDEPQLVPELHRRAASWLAANGEPEAAIEHARAAGDTDVEAQLVLAHGFPFYRAGRVATVRRWFSRFDDPGLLERYPAIAALGAILLALGGQDADAERWARALEPSSPDLPMPDGSTLAAWRSMLRAISSRDGVEQLAVDAGQAVDTLAPGSPFLAGATMLAGVAALLAGRLDEAEESLAEAQALAAAQTATTAGLIAAAERAVLALGRGDTSAAADRIREAWQFVAPSVATEYPQAAILLAADARLCVLAGDAERARELLTMAQRLRPELTRSARWLSVQARLELARAHLALADPDGATVLLREAEALARGGSLGVLSEQLDDVRDQLRSVTAPGAGWATTLTAAELRLLPLLTTHLSFAEIAERLYVSRNTVKTQAISIYRKLDVSSRSEAIARARELGLVDAAATARAER